MSSITQFDQYLADKKILILGFGKEGKSTYNFIKKHYPKNSLGIADLNIVELPISDIETKIDYGPDYLKAIENYEIIIKSPGISLPETYRQSRAFFLTSQTEIFINIFKNQIIGITGTKGKSTTASLLYHLLKEAGIKSHLGGNIGCPVFDLVDEIEDDSQIVLELSSHQLQYQQNSPHISILLNVYPEHLDYYRDFEDYRSAKLNITKFHNQDDLLIFPKKEFCKIDTDGQLVSFEVVDLTDENAEIDIFNNDIKYKITLDRTKIKLPGDHNLINIGAALSALKAANYSLDKFIPGIYSFDGLKHRLQDCGSIDNLTFINDSISTIPQTTIAAIEVYHKKVESLIIGGHSRGDGIVFDNLARFILNSEIDNLFFLPETGKTVYQEVINSGAKVVSESSEFNLLEYQNKKIRAFFIEDLSVVVQKAYQYHKSSKSKEICLLSPAATSYNRYKNFEERGEAFISAIKQIKQ